MLPKPIALPAATKTAPILLPNESLFCSIKLYNLTNLTFERHTHSRHLATQRRCNFSHLALRFAYLRKTSVQSVDYILCYALDGVLCATHLFAHQLVDRQIVYRLRNIVILSNRSQFGCQAQRNLEVASCLLLKLVATVEGVEIHTFQLDCIQFLLHLLDDYKVVILLAALHEHILLGNQILGRHYALNICYLLLVERHATALNHLAALAL